MSAAPLPIQVQARPPRWSVYLYHRASHLTFLWCGFALSLAGAERRARYTMESDTGCPGAECETLWAEQEAPACS